MPFTPVHGLAALPFRRTRLDVPAIVVGSLSPDFVYFVHFKMWGHYGHTLRGVFVHDLPEALVLLVLYRLCLEPTLRLWYWPHAAPAPKRTWPARIALAVICILLGAFSHILWDSFTHPTFWPYEHWMWVRASVRLPLHHPLPMYKVLQYGSTILGSLTLLVLWWRASRATPTHPAPPGIPSRAKALLAGLACLAPIAAFVYVWSTQGPPGRFVGRRIYLVEVIVCTCSFFVLEVLALHGVFYRLTPKEPNDS